ncbi:hypothetical protein R5R35_001785 [Gryllus longicercus]|uniref:Chitin-binding type-4 domain-containing protein n=1 Tax=Gryllus longicercus TaxID=2509291 RepID=A0AAN9ZCL3_9ORTH
MAPPLPRAPPRALLMGLWLLLLQALRPAGVEGHARLMDPPARNSMWRLGFPNPVDYDDNELYCGGWSVQHQQNGGRCGVCGDPWNQREPRAHEAGGKFAKGIIGRRYTVGQDITIEVDLTSNHYGYFEAKICPNNNPRYEATQECFDRYPLYVSGTRDVAMQIPPDTPKKAYLPYRVRLPPYLTCTQCVIQWTYYTGNMWGICPNGTGANGCGTPEWFRNCADVSVVTTTAGLPPPFVSAQDNPFLLYYRDLRAPYQVTPLVVRAQVCLPTDAYRRLPGMRDWCRSNCLRYPPNCPPMLCQCPDQCDAIGELAGREGADAHCQDMCIVNNPQCPEDQCSCY